MSKYDYLIVGAGLFGSVFARCATDAGKNCLVIERRNHIGGNCYTENAGGVQVHKYGAHILHTSDEKIWNYINRFCKFVPFVNSPVANYKGKLYNLPFNMNTFYTLWGTITPEEAKNKIAEQIPKGLDEPKNLEEQALKLVGRDIYEILIKGYTEKQWGRECKELPAFIIKRLPLRFTYDNNYFNDIYQGIPAGGYTFMFEKLLDGIDVKLNTDFIKQRSFYGNIAKKTVYTGPVDELFDYCYGELEYRSLRFDTVRVNVDNFQGNAVVNYTERQIPYTRIIEHRHFDRQLAQIKLGYSLITYEYPEFWSRGKEPYYPINNVKNDAVAKEYVKLAEQNEFILGGRLANYKYYDMDKVIANALDLAEHIL